MQSQQPPHPVYFDQNYVTPGLPSQPRFQVCNGRRHLYQNFAPSPPTNGFVRSSSSSHNLSAPACQTNLTRPLNPPVHFKTWSHDNSSQQPIGQLQSSTIRPSGLLRPPHPGHYATVICQQPSTHPRASGLSSTAVHHNHPVEFTGPPTTTPTAHSLHNFSNPHSAHVEVPNMRGPYAQGPHVVCRRNPPPPPPPRSNSWLGRDSGDSSHVPSHITSGSHHPAPTPYTTATTTVTETCISRGRHVQSYPAPSGAFAEPQRLQGPSSVVGSWPPCSNGCEHGQVLRPAVITPVTNAVATQPTDCTARSEVTDTLLRLLICHYTTSPSNPSAQRDPTILDRLLRAVCGTNRSLGGGGFMDSEVASLAQGILPHLIRIIYTEVLGVNAEAADEGYGLRTPWQENPTGDANSCVPLERRANETSDPTVKAESSELSMTTSMESRHSDEEEGDLDDLGEYDVETVLNVLEDKPSGWTTGAQLDALPPGTSIEELKNAAMEAIFRLVPMCQADSNLCERDLGIIHLLKTIQTYTNVQQARLKQSLSSVDPLSSSHPRCPVAEVAALVRLSFYPEHRTAICGLGGVHALIALLRAEQAASTEPNDIGSFHNCSSNDKPSHDSQASLEHHHHETSLALRRYICMALTNLTFGVAENKALICRRVANLEALLAQLESGNEELKQVSASVLRNLCWRTDSRSKLALRRVNAPRRLTLAAMNAQRDSTLRTTLSALWNLSAHCSHNKRAVCSVDGVFSFLLGTMHCKDLSNRLVIVENSGGILRNVSAVVAGREDYRILLHQNNCYHVLIELLRHSPSLTVVVNVCGTLWNLTASPRCPTDDLVLLCRLGVVDLLHQLARSSHELIRNSSTAVLRNLMQPPRQTQQLPAGMGPISRETSNFEHKYDNNFAQNDTDPSSPSADSKDDVGDEDESSCNTDQSCRRRLNSRARLRFGLLSVVLEADDADEEAAEETDDSDDEEEDTYEDEGSIYPDQEAMVTDDSSDIGSRRIVPASIGNVGPQQLVNQAVTDGCAWQQSDTDEEQACVYAEEGTPYPPDSTTASSLELHQQPNKTRRGPSEDFYLDDSDYYASGQPPIELTSYTSSDGLLHVYASEGSPSQLMSVSPSVVSVSPPSEPHKLSDVFNTRVTSQRPSDVSDEGPQLPSPPPDVSGLVSPLLTMQLNDFDPDVSGFTLPPPPLQTVQERQIPVSTAESSAISPIPTPLIFSRGTSSYISSTDLGDLPVGVQSSPQSEYSEQPLMHESDFTDEIDTNPDSRDAISRHESGIDEDADEDHEERLAPLTFSNGDGVEEGNEGEEVRLAFAEEGTPQDTRSSSVNESLLAFPSRSCGRASGPPLHCAIYGWPDRNSHTVPDTSGHLVDDPDDEDEQGQSHILQQCIASAMPGNASFTLRADIPSGLKFPSNHSTQIALFPQADDTVQSFAVEDTPFGTSTKTSSASDLFALDGKAEHLPDPSPVSLHQNRNPDTPLEVHKPLPHSEPCSSPGSAGRIGSSSSINGDTSSDLLSEVIQSAMPKAAQSGLSDCCPVPSDGDCLQLYAVEGIPGEDDLSESSSMQHMNSSGLNSLSTQPSLHCSSTTSPAMDVVGTVSGMGSSETGLSAPPAPPRRTTSVLSSQKDPFAPTSPSVTRPQATVAPMPQVQQCPPITTEPAGPLKPDRLLITDGLRGTHRASLTPADKDDASSFSSLLSIESVGLEHSLLQECITSAMPRPKLSGPLRRQQHQPWEPVQTGFSGSNEADLFKLSASAQPGDHNESGPITAEPQVLSADLDSPPLGSGISAPIPKLSSTGACSSLGSLASSVGHKSAPSASTTTAGLVTDQAPLSGRTKRSGALHFLANGSDDAPHPPQCYIPTTATNDSRMSPGPTVVRLSAENVTNDGALSEATAAATNESSRLIPPSTVPHQSSLPVRESRLPCLKRVQPVSPQVVKERNITGVNDQAATGHTLSNMLAEGTQAILAALQAAADEDNVSSEQMNLSDRPLLSVELSTRATSVSPGTAISSNHRIPTASVLPTRLVQPSQITKPCTVPQSKIDGSKLDPKNSVKPTSKIVTPVQVATQCLKTDKAKAEKPARAVTKQYRPTTTTHVIQSKTPSVQRSGLRLPAKHSIPSRLASTCPPSATGRSPVSSRSTSVSGSQNNLHLPGSKLIAPSQSVSAQSIYAALAKQERHTTTNSSKLAKPTSAATSKYRYSSSASTIPTSVKNCHPESKALSTSNGHLSNMHPSSGQLTSNFGYTAASSSSLVSDDNGPKPIRGGRKSLTGRKVATTNDKVLEKVVIRPNGPASRTSTQVNGAANQTLRDSVGHRVPCTSSHVEPTPTPKSAKSTVTKFPSTTCSGSTNKTGVIRSSSSTSPSKLQTEHGDTEAGMWIVRGELTMVERAS